MDTKKVDCIDSVAVVEVSGDTVRLVASFNPDASCCQDDDSGEILQLERYADHGWFEPKDNPRLATDFWNVWTEWNGKMCGGIYLDDEYTYARAYEWIGTLPELSPSDIATAGDGTYAVIGRI